MKDFSFSCRRLLPQNIERIRELLNYVDIIEKNIYNIDSKICGIIDDYKVLRDSQKVADYVIQFLRTYLETIAARIYAYENPDKPHYYNMSSFKNSLGFHLAIGYPF